MHVHCIEKQLFCVYVSPHIESITQFVETASGLLLQEVSDCRSEALNI